MSGKITIPIFAELNLDLHHVADIELGEDEIDQLEAKIIRVLEDLTA